MSEQIHVKAIINNLESTAHMCTLIQCVFHLFKTGVRWAKCCLRFPIFVIFPCWEFPPLDKTKMGLADVVGGKLWHSKQCSVWFSKRRCFPFESWEDAPGT